VLLATAIKSYEYAKVHLGSWCAARIWRFALAACREELSVLDHSQLLSCLNLLEAAELLARELEVSYPWPTLKGVSEKLCRLVGTLKGTENRTIQPAIVTVNSAPAALVIAELIKRVGSIDERLGMGNVRVIGLIGAGQFGARSFPRLRNRLLEKKIKDFKNGQSDIIVASGVPLKVLPTDESHNIIQFDVAEFLDVEDLAYQYMVVRTNHSLASFLGRAFLKTVICTDVFVADLSHTPNLLHRGSLRVYASIDHSETVRTSLGMTLITGSFTDALHTLIQGCSYRFPRPENWVTFADNRHSMFTTTPATAAVNAIQHAIGYTFSDVQLLIDAMNLRSRACERLEFVGDGALELVSTSHWMKEHPVAHLGKIDQIKAASVCNNFLAMICIELHLHQWINSSPEFRSGLAQIMPSHRAMLASNQSGDFWMEVDYPKGLADVMEAIFGAVYLDSVFDVSAVVSVFDRCLLPAIQRYISIDTVVFAQCKLAQRCRHFQFTFTNGCHSQNGTASEECTVTLGGTTLEKATHTKKSLAKRAACRKTLERLDREPGLFARLCNCFHRE
jgi:dsRNA-specific ribonuclease